MLYGYCVRFASHAPPTPGTAGIDGRPVRMHSVADLGIWVSEVEGPVEPSEERLRQHERVVRDALRTATPLPLRFGTVFGSTAALEDAIEARGDAFRRTLERVEGLVEMVIRVERKHPVGQTEAVARGDASTGVSAGRAYLERRRSELESRERSRQDADTLLWEIEKELGRQTVKVTISAAPEGSLVGRLACLVRRGEVPAFREHVGRVIEARRPELRLGVTGPWAPYSFANE